MDAIEKPTSSPNAVATHGAHWDIEPAMVAGRGSPGTGTAPVRQRGSFVCGRVEPLHPNTPTSLPQRANRGPLGPTFPSICWGVNFFPPIGASLCMRASVKYFASARLGLAATCPTLGCPTLSVEIQVGQGVHAMRLGGRRKAKQNPPEG